MEHQMNIKEVACLWRKDKAQYVKLSTISAYSLILEKHILPAFGNNMQLTEEEVQRFVLQKLQSGLSQKSVRDILVVLKMIQRFGSKRGYLSPQDWSIHFPTERENADLAVLTVSQQRKVMQYVSEHFTFRNLGIYICLCTGMRIGEVCALRWGDINLAAESINVQRTIERIYVVNGEHRHTELIIGPPKTKNSIREIPVNRSLKQMLKPLRQLMNDNYYVLTGEATPTEPRTYRNYYNRLMRQLELPPMKFHGLRHSFATRCIESHCDYKTVSVLLGHANIGTTLNLYVHPDNEQKRRCVEQMSTKLLR